jgi:hypothetical protein
MKTMVWALALSAALCSAAMAQSDGSKGDNSETTQCQSRLERAELRAQSMTDGAKQGEVAQAIRNAREAMMAGNSLKCVVELEKVGTQ